MPETPTTEFELPSTETPKESRFAKYGPAIFWGSMIAMPALNLAAALVNAKTANKGLEIEQLKLQIEQLQLAQLKQ